MIEINRPTMEKIGGGGGYRISSLISINNEEKVTLWYEVEQEYRDYLVTEKADAFLIAVLPFAMMSGNDITVKDVPVSEDIYWSLTREYIPTIGKYSELFNRIQINTEITDLRFESKGVGAGFSAGIDSFYTILRNLNQNTNDYNLTHLTFFNVGACGYGSDHGGEEAQKVFRERIEQFEPIVKELGLKMIKVNSNIGDFKPVNYNWIHSFKSASAVLVLQKLFSKYYYSSGAPLACFSLDHHDSANYDILSSCCFSTENTRIYSVGLWEDRIEKVQYISQYPITYDVLNVCNNEAMNCCVCDKCIRTMGELYALGKLQEYKKSFDVDRWNSHLSKYMARVISKKYDGTVEAKFNQEILDTAKKNGMKVPITSYIIAVPGMLKSKMISLVKKNKFIRMKYHERLVRERGMYFPDVNKT